MLLCIRVGPAMHIFSNPWLKKHTHKKTLNPPQAALINRNKLTALLKHPFRLLSVTADDTTQWRQTKKALSVDMLWIYSELAQCFGRPAALRGALPLVPPTHTQPATPTMWRWKERCYLWVDCDRCPSTETKTWRAEGNPYEWHRNAS